MVLDTRILRTELHKLRYMIPIVNELIDRQLVNTLLESAIIIAPLYVLGEARAVYIEVADFSYMISGDYGEALQGDIKDVSAVMYHMLSAIDAQYRPLVSYLYTREIKSFSWNGPLVQINLENING